MFSRGVLILWLLALVCEPGGARDVSVRFELPRGDPPVVRAAVFDAGSDLSQPHVQVHAIDPDVLVLSATPGADVVVKFDRDDDTYYLDGPFRWPASGATRLVPPVPRYTAVGTVVADVPDDDPPRWLDRDGALDAQPWPRCRRTRRAWECAGVPLLEPGVVVIGSDPMAYAVLSADVLPTRRGVSTRLARWAMLLLLQADDEDRLERPRVQLLEPQVSRFRAEGVRVMLRDATSARVHALARGVYFLAGTGNHEDLVLQVGGEDIAVVRTAISTAPDGLRPAMHVRLDAAAAVHGRVVNERDEPATGARLGLSELIDIREPDGQIRRLKRSLADVEPDADASFTLRGLGPGRYEVLALHPTWGRGSIVFEPGDRRLVIRLVAGSRVAGRVLQNGLPAAGVWVDVPGDRDAYVRAADPMDVVAPSAQTAADGRFTIALPPSGARELRIGADQAAVRVPIPPISANATLDIGDIHLRSPIAVQVTYVGDERCALLAAGPMGHSGLTMVEAQVIGPGARRLLLPESGTWLLTVRCGGRESPVQPAAIDVPPQVAAWSAHVVAIRP